MLVDDIVFGADMLVVTVDTVGRNALAIVVVNAVVINLRTLELDEQHDVNIGG